MAAFGIGSRGYKDFGLSSNMTLPITNSSIEPDPKVLAENAYMPGERKQKKRKQARFALDESQEKVVEQRKPSWFKRLFRRKKKSDPYLVQQEDEDIVAVVRSESDPELSASKGRVGDDDEGGKPQRRKAKSTKESRQAKAQSTAFEHIAPASITAGQDRAVKVTFKPSSPTKGPRRVIMQYREETVDGLGLYLSGVIPPITATHVKPRGQANLVGIEVGDIILEINGVNCRKEVETAHFLALKLLRAQARKKEERWQDIDDESEGELRRDLEPDHSIVKITSIDSSGSEEDTATPRVVEAEVKTRKVKKTRMSSSRASGGDFGDPLATSSPMRDENGEKLKRKKRASHRSSTGAEENIISGIMEDGGGNASIKSSLKKKPAETSASEGAKTSSEDGKKKKRKTSKKAGDSPTENSVAKSPPKKSLEVNTTEDGGNASKSSLKKTSASEGAKSTSDGKKKRSSKKAGESPTEKSVTKSPSRKSLEVSKLSLSSGVTSVTTVQVEVSDVQSNSPWQASISVDEVDSSAYEMERSARSRRSSSPKSRYRSMEEEDVGETAKEKGRKKKPKAKTSEKKGDTDNGVSTKGKAGRKKTKSKESEQGEPEKVTVAAITKEKGSKKKPKAEDGDKKKKGKKSKEESTPRKVSKDQSQGSTMHTPEQHGDEPPLSLSVDAPLAQSAAISGSIESNTLMFVSKKGSRSKSSLNELGDEETQAKRETNTLPRRKSMDQSRSSSEVSEFRNELREASRSQHDMPEAVDSSMTIEIDPNIKVKKSGLIKGAQTGVRPSIFNQSSSPEPEEVEPISSGPVEDNLLDSEFKVKKSGVVQGRKTSATARPSILDEDTKGKNIQRGEMKYNKKVIKETDMDLSAVPDTAPTLGLVAGRDRLDTANRSLIKRRPATQKQSLLLDSKEGNTSMGMERVDLSFHGKDDKPAGSVGAAKQMFESGNQQNAAAKYSARFSMLEKKFNNAVSATTTTQANKLPASGEKKAPWARPQSTSGGDKGTPSWVALAQQKRSSLYKETPATTTPTKVTPSKVVPAPSQVPPSSTSKDGSVPQHGTVAQRLAMFQKH